MLTRDKPPALEFTLGSAEDADAVVEVIHAAFGARQRLDPPPAALTETAESIRQRLTRADAVLAWVGPRLAGVVLVEPQPGAVAGLQRVSVHPEFQGHGVAAAMLGAVHGLCVERQYRSAELYVRREFPRLGQWWQRHGYRPDPQRHDADGGVWVRPLPTRIAVPDAQAMHRLGVRLAARLERGDVVILTGELGAGKTTLTQGIGAGLAVAGPIISPTFVLSRIHRALPTDDGAVGPDLVHVDAYRLGDAAELTDLDLDSDLAASVTVVEWGEGLAEQLSPQRLEIEITRPESVDGPEGDTRSVWLQPIGPRWDGVDLARLGADL